MTDFLFYFLTSFYYLGAVCTAVPAQNTRKHHQFGQPCRLNRSERRSSLCGNQGEFLCMCQMLKIILKVIAILPYIHQGAITAMTKAMAVDESRYQVRVNWWVTLSACLSCFLLLYLYLNYLFSLWLYFLWSYWISICELCLLIMFITSL